MKKLKLKKKYRIYLLNTGLIVLFLIFLFSTYKFGRIYYYERNANETQKEIIKKVVKYEENIEEDSEEVKIDFEALEKINSDVVGWIEIPKTNIFYPILQGEDNEYYLNKDVYKKYNINGSIYMNYLNKDDFSDNNTILFGHNTHNDMMFSDLEKMYDEKIKSDLVINIYTKDEIYRYEIYSMYITQPTDELPLNVETNYFNKSDKEFNNTIKDGKTLTLSSCYKDDSKRVIIHAIREN